MSECIYCPACGNKIPYPNTKFCSRKCSSIYRKIESNAFIASGKAKSPKRIRKYLLETSGHKCNRCGNTHWNGQPITIELEHIDGNSDNNNLDNLELLCPNCHSQTPTYKAKNIGNGRHKRRERYKNGHSY